MDFLNEGIEQIDNFPSIPGEISDFLESADSAASTNQPQVNRRAVRWIVMAGNTLPPYFTRAVREMRMGGENLAQSLKTLTRATNGYLRRCQLTPLSVGKDFLNEDSLGDDKDKFKFIDDWNAKTQKMERRYYVECLPGDELQGLIEGQQGAGGIFDKGIREVGALFDDSAIEPGTTQYQSALRRGLNYQKTIFPNWHNYLNGKEEFFVKSADLTAYLLNKRDELTGDETAIAIIDILLESNAQWERWATSNLSRMKDTIEAGKQVGEIYNWNAEQVEYFKVMDLNREQFLQKRSDSNPAATDSVSRAEFAEQGKKLDGLMSAVEQVLPAIGQLANIAVRDHKAEESSVNNNTAEGERLARKFSVGDVVSVQGKTGIIVGKPGGRPTIEFEDGDKQTVKPEDID